MAPSITQLLIILGIILLLFGTKKLRNLGGDLGGAIRGFKKAVKEGEDKPAADSSEKLESKEGDIIEGEVTEKKTDKDKA